MGTFGTLLCLWICTFIGTDTNFADWLSRLFTEPWPGCPPECLSRHLGSQISAPRGRPRALQPPWAPGPGHAPGRCRPRPDSAADSILSCLFGHFLGQLWAFCTVLGLHWYYKLQCIDLEIWTLGIDISPFGYILDMQLPTFTCWHYFGTISI